MDSKLRELMETVTEKTSRDGLEWTAFDSESFRTKIGSCYLHIQRGSTDGETSLPHVTYAVQISDAQGRVVAEGEATEGFDGFAVFDQLFQAARKAALASDRVIDDMLNTLRAGVRA